MMGSIVCVISVALCGQLQESPPTASDLPDWVHDVHTYGMIPLLPEEAKQMNVTVNGAWAGFGGHDPILPHPQWMSDVGAKYGTDAKAFADACHEAGLVVVCGINGVEGMIPLLEKRLPNWEKLACRKADGSTLNWMGPDAWMMCTNNPEWVQFELEYGKEGIDNGADLILLDTPQGSAIAGGVVNAGFCDACMAAFQQYLEGKYSPEEMVSKWGITEFKKEDIIKRLGTAELVPYVERVKKDALFAEYTEFQEQASFRTRKELLDGLRAYAKEKNRSIVLSSNTVNLGTGNPGGYWIRGLMFADTVDQFVYEISYYTDGAMGKDLPLPRGKFTAYHRLAHAVTGLRSAAVISSGFIGRNAANWLQNEETHNAWMGALAAEAYAANGAYIMYYFELPPGNKQLKDRLWKDAAEVCDYVQKHKDLYEGELRSGSPVALVLLENDRGRAIPAAYPSYFGFAQALTEGNYPFDVVFGGDDKYVADRLTAADLQGYKALIVPSPIAPTENQKKLIQEFVEAGGTVVCMEPDALGFSGESTPAESPLKGVMAVGSGQVWRIDGTISATEMTDAGSKFFYNYDDENRKALYALAERLGLEAMLPNQQDGTVAAYPLLQPEQKRLLLHLVNFDVDSDSDSLRPKSGIEVRAALPDFLGENLHGEYYTPGQNAPQGVEIAVEGSVVRCTVPELNLMGSLVLSGE